MTEYTGEVVLAQGSATRVLAARLVNGGCPALEFLEGLRPRPRAQFRALLDRLAEVGAILGEERFRKLEGSTGEGRLAVWEIKSHEGPGWRLYTIRCGGDWLATHGGRKPGDRQLAAEVARARRIYKERSSP